MTARTIESDGRQAELEARAISMRDADTGQESDVKAVFGAAPEWIMEIGSFRLLLIPFLGEWWFYDDIHGEWRFTGKKIGQTRFALRDGGLRMLDPPHDAEPPAAQERAAQADAGPSPPAPAPSPPYEAPAPVTRFCSACGASVQPQWKFCRKCGAKLQRPA